MQTLETRPWWGYIEVDLQELFKQAFLLLEMSKLEPGKFRDYSYIVFPAAKAYEGFLKKLFFDLRFIGEEEYYGNRWRVGKALNPFLEKEYRQESVYDRIVGFCGGKELADRLWETWKRCRNLVFHFFPNEKNAVSLPEAEERLNTIVDAIDAATKECNINTEGK